MLTFVKVIKGDGRRGDGARKWLINFLIETYKTETTVGVTVGLAPMLNSVRI